jgi:hypothetical protein
VRVAFAIALNYATGGWKIEMIDVEAAFLNGELKTKMYLKWPDGMVELGFLSKDDFETTCIDLQKSMYGNVDAALLWQETVQKFFVNEVGLTQSAVDPCIYFQHVDGTLTLIVVVYVDDMLLLGLQSKIDWMKDVMSAKFTITALGPLKKHLGIYYKWTKDAYGVNLIADMQSMADEIVQKFQEVIGRLPILVSTPGAPGKCLSKNDGDVIMMEEYRSIIGKVMYYVSKIAPECANAAHELAQHMSNPGDEHWMALERVCGYIMGKSEHTLKFRAPREFRVITYADADYAKDTDTRRSVSGSIHTVGGTLTTWMSKTQNSVTLSSTESEYVSLSMAAQEVKFMQMLLDELVGCVKPGVILEDNTGAIFLVKNSQVGMRTKHIDVRHHFLRELWKHGEVSPLYIKSEDNVADVMTKNVSETLFYRLVPDLLNETMRCWKEDVRIDG